MAEKEVTIKISAKNLTESEFKKVRAGLAGIGDSADKTGTQAEGMSGKFGAFAKAAPGALKIVAAAATATAAAVAGLVAGVVKLGERGAVVGDVKSAFDALSRSAGSTGEAMLGALQRGVKGTITDFELMRLANTALGAGLLSTARDAETLSQGARLLAKRTGGDTATAFQTLTSAMASGRTAQLKQLGLFVDSKKAIEDYAAATGQTVSTMTDADRATALQIATLAALRGELERNAPPLADFGELIERGKVGVKNLVDELAVVISNSPVLLAGMNAAGDAIEKAFGGDTSGAMTLVVNLIEKAALVAVELGQAGLTAADFLVRGFSGVKLIFLGLSAPLTEIGQRLSELVLFSVEVAAKVPGMGSAYEGVAEKARAFNDAATGINQGLKEQVADAAATVAGHGELTAKLQEGRAVLSEISTAMTNAGLTQQTYNTTVREAGVVVGNLSASLRTAAVDLSALVPVTTDWQGKLIESKPEVAAWAAATAAAYQYSGGAAVTFGTAVKGVGDLVHSSNVRAEASARHLGIVTRDAAKETEAEIMASLDAIVAKYGEYSVEAIKAQKELDTFRKESTEDASKSQLSTHEAFSSGAGQVFSALGGKYQKYAAAEGAISALLAAVKTMATTPWPANIPMAAAALAAGIAVVSKIKAAVTPGFRGGTDSLDFQQFGAGTMATLHGPEAVIPQGSGHLLGREIAAELGGTSSSAMSDANVLGALSDIGSKLDQLPAAIYRGFRDARLLSGG